MNIAADLQRGTSFSEWRKYVRNKMKHIFENFIVKHDEPLDSS